MTAETQKDLGAFYTEGTIAQALVRWAVRRPDERVMDPGFGGGVFLQAALERLGRLNGHGGRAIFGVEIDAAAYASTVKQLCGCMQTGGLMRRDFFSVLPRELPKMSAIVGNPPFIRYQRFRGEARRLALLRASEAGVRLPQLASAWAPFLIHATRFLDQGGRLGMVAPLELIHAHYARPVLHYFLHQFREVTLIVFSSRIFRELNEHTLLILASGYGQPPAKLRLLRLANGRELASGDLESLSRKRGTEVDTEAVLSGRHRIIEYLLPEMTRGLYADLASSDAVSRLGELADVGIGYVTGHNEYFHVSRSDVRDFRWPKHLLKPTVRNGEQLTGILFSRSDWRRNYEAGARNLLLALPGNPRTSLGSGVHLYLAKGRKLGVHLAYKCRVRRPWYAVPHVYVADAFLTYMSNDFPRLVANAAGAVAPNTLHLVRLRKRLPGGMRQLATSFYNSLTLLSAEIEGHALGGGMLKLEPTEAERLLVPRIHYALNPIQLRAVATQMDKLLRTGDYKSALELGDQLFLREKLGLTTQECARLRSGYQLLRDFRRIR